jgi:acyl carrier protein
MGLDTVELVIRFEDAFGIKIPDKVAEELTTPREVTNYVWSQLKLVDQTPCLSQQAFYALRREFVPLLGIERAEFSPSAKLSELVPIENRTRIWKDVRARIGTAALPDLVRPGWLLLLLSTLTLFTAVLGFLGWGPWWGFLAAGVVVFVSESVTRPFKRKFQVEYADAGALAKYLATHMPHLVRKEWTSEEVAQTVRKIVIEQTGTSDFTDDSRFVQDLHMD